MHHIVVLASLTLCLRNYFRLIIYYEIWHCLFALRRDSQLSALMNSILASLPSAILSMTPTHIISSSLKIIPIRLLLLCTHPQSAFPFTTEKVSDSIVSPPPFHISQSLPGVFIWSINLPSTLSAHSIHQAVPTAFTGLSSHQNASKTLPTLSAGLALIQT